jgi:SAM-dependent methyltransferase/GNAT superfamily N-acetyltransferase
VTRPAVEFGILPRASAEDPIVVAEIAQLVNRVYEVAEDGLWVEGATRTDDADIADQIRRQELMTARLGGRIVGAVHVQQLDADTGGFGMLAVAPDLRGTGIGRDLVSFVEGWARDRRLSGMQLELLVPREWSHPWKERLRDWYIRLGYRVVHTGRLGELYPALEPRLATPCDLLVFRKELTDRTIGRMGEYVLDHHLEGEPSRLALMSRLLDPMHRRHLESLGLRRGAQTLEVGCGNGSMSAWLAERVGPSGRAVAVDLDLSLVDVQAANLELRRADIVAGPVEPGTFDLVTARAVLHHVADVEAAIRNLVASLAPGGSILLIEPDFLPVSVAEPPDVRAFWNGWLAWSRDEGIDYHVGRALAPRLAALGLEEIAGTAETAVYNGGSLWASYWMQTVTELRDGLLQSGHLNDELIDGFLTRCADSRWWTQTIAFTAVHARALAG